MERIVSDTARLSESEASFREQLAIAREILKSIEDDITVLNSMWDGPAKQSFSQEFKDGIKALFESCDALEDVADFEENARNEYHKCAAAIDDLIEGISLDL